MEKKGYISVAEAVELSGFSTATLYRWLDGEKVRGLRYGGARYVHKKSLQRELRA